MKTQLKEILDTLYEAEGLIELALGRDRETMARIALLVKSKCFHTADLASLIPDAEKEAETPGTEVKEATAEVPVGSDAIIDVVIGDSGLAVTTTTGPDDAEKLFMEKVAPKIAPAPAEDKNTEMADDPEAEAEHEESDAIRTEQEEELNHTESESASEPETESDSGQEISDTEEAAAQMVAEDLDAELRGDVKARTTPGFEQRAESDASMFADAAEFEEAEDAGEEPKARASQNDSLFDAEEFEQAADQAPRTDSLLAGHEDATEDEQTPEVAEEAGPGKEAEEPFAGEFDEEPDEEPVDFEDEQLEEEYDEPDEEELAREREVMHNRKPIATFFSINDKYRFRRELFSNSNPEWLQALALLETMADMQEAEDYLFDDLQWDPESIDVKAFIQVLERYYKS